MQSCWLDNPSPDSISQFVSSILSSHKIYRIYFGLNMRRAQREPQGYVGLTRACQTLSGPLLRSAAVCTAYPTCCTLRRSLLGPAVALSQSVAARHGCNYLAALRNSKIHPTRELGDFKVARVVMFKGRRLPR